MALFVGAIGLIALIQTLNETRRSVDVAVDALHSQRPYVSLGNKENVVAQYYESHMDGKDGTLLLYFHNTGSMPALNFLVNVGKGVPSSPVWCLGGGHHIARIDRLYKPRGERLFPGNTIGAESVYEIPILEVCVPKLDEWKKIQAGASDYIMKGNLEYCDWWGQYQCEMFTIKYDVPAGRFFGETKSCPDDYPSSSVENERELARDDGPRSFPRCEQPEERKQAKRK
jgi:hypothetical protein